MPVFHFDVHVGSSLVEDVAGALLRDIAAAEEEARRAVLEIAKYRLIDGHDAISIKVRDGGNRLVLTATASVEITRH